jgi:hypothetical protein
MLDFSLWRRPMLKPGMEAAHSLFGERNESILLRRMSPIVFDKGENNGRERKDRTAPG